MSRGILSTVYAKLVEEVPADKVAGIYQDFDRDEQFVRVVSAKLRDVRAKTLIVWAEELVSGSRVVEEANQLFSEASGGRAAVVTATPETITSVIAEFPDHRPVVVYPVGYGEEYRPGGEGYGAVAVKTTEGTVPHANHINHPNNM